MWVCVCVCVRGNISLNWETGRNQQSWNVLNIVDVYRAEFVPNPHAITCRYKSYRQIKFWHDSLSWHKFQDSSRERRRDGDTDMCFILSFPRFLAKLSSLSLSLFLSLFFLFIAHVTRLFIVLYTRASKLRCYRYSFADHSLRLSIFRRFARSNLDKVYFPRAEEKGRRKGKGRRKYESNISLGGKEKAS